MGVYIKSMEMPKYGCDHCFLRTGNYCGRIEKDESVVEYAIKNERHPDCPLVPVPPHGRLIDADALIVHKFVGAEHDISITDGGACYRRGWNDAIEAVMENAETIIGGK